VNCENPRIHGKGLTAKRSGQWIVEGLIMNINLYIELKIIT